MSARERPVFPFVWCCVENSGAFMSKKNAKPSREAPAIAREDSPIVY